MRSNSDFKEKIELNSLIAKTHPAEYLIHKYWARKPHNILALYIKKYFTEKDILVDPFAGSGVFLAEAKKQNISSYGFDVNPIATLISDVTTNPPDINELKIKLDSLIQYTEEKYSDLYKIDNKKIRYITHLILTECSECKTNHTILDCEKRGNSYYCKKCNTKLSFNFENMLSTKIFKIIDIDNKEYYFNDSEDFLKQEELSKKWDIKSKYDKELILNRRILAFPNMKHSNLFTSRAYYILNDLFEQAELIENDSIKKSIKLFLTSCTAQCSRLIPYRNNLSTGGPAWTMPGFWIAPMHLETNPIIHIKARSKKFINGIIALKNNYKNTTAKSNVLNLSINKGFDLLPDESVDGIFFDPPYGDNVPYLEFSAIWNNFISDKIYYDEEIVVSDRKVFKSNWEKYQQDIDKTINIFSKKLKFGGKVIMTFNNINPKAWKIVIDGFNNNNLKCISANYQIPAVVSTKAQMASNTSYIGDFYCVFEKTNTHLPNKTVLHNLTEITKQILISRENKAPKNLIYRTLILNILRNNLDTEKFNLLEESILPVATSDKEYFYLRPECINEKDKIVSIKEILINVAKENLTNQKFLIEDFYEKIIQKTEYIGVPPMQEVKYLLNGIVFFEKDFCYLQ